MASCRDSLLRGQQLLWLIEALGAVPLGPPGRSPPLYVQSLRPRLLWGPLQECKALNQRLVDFLKRPESVARLLEYVTQPAPSDAEDKRQFKYPFSACEVHGEPHSPDAELDRVPRQRGCRMGAHHILIPEC